MTSGKQFFSTHWPILIIVLISAFLLFFRLDRDLLADWDECVYSVHAIEMRETGNPLVNQWNGTVDFLKPPLYTWLLQVPYLFGVSEFSTRILSVIFALLLIATVYSFCRKYFSTVAAVCASLLLLASELFVDISRRANTDMGFALLVFSGYYFWRLSEEKKRCIYLSGISFGLAVLMKGLGVIPFFMAIFLSLFFEPRKNRFVDYLIVVGVFLLTILPWHLASYVFYGEQFLRDYFFEGVIKRSQFPLESHEGPWYKYLSQLKRMMFPWIYLGAIFPVVFARDLLFRPGRGVFGTHERTLTILLLVIVPLFFLSKMQTKLAWYALPIYPFLVVYLSKNVQILLEYVSGRRAAHAAVILLIATDAFMTVAQETRLSTAQREITPRNDMLLRIGTYPHQDLHYLVEPAKREQLLGLPPEQRHSNTLLFGGNPCALHYTRQKLKFYYDPEAFRQSFASEDGLFLMHHYDMARIPSELQTVLYKNEDYVLIRSSRAITTEHPGDG